MLTKEKCFLAQFVYILQTAISEGSFGIGEPRN